MGGRAWIKPFDGTPYEAYMNCGRVNFEKGKAEGISEAIARLHDVRGLSASEIAEWTGYSFDEVETMLKKKR